MSSVATPLRAMGGLFEAPAPIHRPATAEELAAIFGEAQRRGARLTLVGGRRSFGEHFLPPEGAEAVDLAALQGSLEVLERDADGLWLRAPGSTTFAELFARFPDHLACHPPTGDRITLAGALSACAHDSAGYFADSVRALTLMTPDRGIHTCTRDASGLPGRLFAHLPGSFGALGAVLSMELRLRKIADNQRAEIRVLEKCGRRDLPRALAALEDAFHSGRYPVGHGAFFFGRGRSTVVLVDRLVVPPPGRAFPELPLANDALETNAYLQGIANRVPRVVQRLLPLGFRKGQRFHARLYPFTFFQRSFERAHELLSADKLVPRALRAVGVDPRLTVCHTTFAVAPEAAARFMDLYFDALDDAPEVAAAIENQDAVRLPRCAWPLHPLHALDDGGLLFSPSFSVRRGTPRDQRVRAFLAELARQAFDSLGVKVMLLKQAHLDDALLARMHAPWVEAVRALRREADPRRRLTSRLLERLGV